MNSKLNEAINFTDTDNQTYYHEEVHTKHKCTGPSYSRKTYKS